MRPLLGCLIKDSRNYDAARQAREALPDVAGLEALVLEAGFVRAIPAHRRPHARLRYLDQRTLVPRAGRGVAWGRGAAAGGSGSSGGRRLAAQGQFVLSLGACRGFLCSGAGANLHV